MSMGETEARIRRLQSRLRDAEYRTSDVGDKILRTRQALGSFRQPSWNPCVTTLTGRVIGGLATATALPNSTVQVTGHVSGTNYGTAVVPTGVYEINLSLDPADTSVDLTAAGPGVRFQANSPVNVPVTQCSSTSVADIQATPAASFVYAQANFGAPGRAFPIATTLNYSHDIFGTGTLTWDGSRWSSGCIGATSNTYSFGIGPTHCSSVNGTVRIALAHGIGFNFGYLGATSCPTASTCPQTIGFTFSFGTVSSSQDPSETVKFDYTFSLQANAELAFHGTVIHAFRAWEP